MKTRRWLATLLVAALAGSLGPTPAFALRQGNAGMEESPVRRQLQRELKPTTSSLTKATTGLEEEVVVPEMARQALESLMPEGSTINVAVTWDQQPHPPNPQWVGDRYLVKMFSFIDSQRNQWTATPPTSEEIETALDERPVGVRAMTRTELLAMLDSAIRITRTAPSAESLPIPPEAHESLRFHSATGEPYHGPTNDAGLEEGIVVRSVAEMRQTSPEVDQISREIETQRGSAPEAIITIPTDREVVIYATREAMNNRLTIALQAEAARTSGFDRLKIQGVTFYAKIPRNAVLLVSADERVAPSSRNDLVKIEIGWVSSLNQLFKLIIEAKLGHPIGGLIIRRSQDLRQIFIFA